MTTIHREAVVNYPDHKMFQLVSDVEHYPDFLPMCESIEIHQDGQEQTKATMHVKKAGITLALTTQNDKHYPDAIDLTLIDGPFKSLTGQWRFYRIDQTSSKISLDLNFEFSNKLMAMAIGPVFNKLANMMLDAFCQRAKDVYGS